MKNKSTAHKRTSIEDEASVNLRRAKIGLGPLEEYLQQFDITYQVPTATLQLGSIIRQVDSLIARHGYPGKSLVGEYLKSTAFIVIQHNPDERYLPLLTAAADKGELSWASLALLVDRVKTDKGEKQVYGTQTHIY